MKTFVAALAAFRILFGGVVAYCQTPLDAPGEKKVTVASEIERGRSEMADAAIKSHTLNLSAYEVEHDEVIERNKAKNTDSDGFLLGALLEQWIFVDQMYPTMASNGFTNKEGAKLVRESLVEHFRRFRRSYSPDADDLIIVSQGVRTGSGYAYTASLNKCSVRGHWPQCWHSTQTCLPRRNDRSCSVRGCRLRHPAFFD